MTPDPLLSSRTRFRSAFNWSSAAAAASLAASIGVFVYIVTDTIRLNAMHTKMTYWLFLSLLLSWIWISIRQAEKSKHAARLIKENASSIMVGLLLTGMVFIAVPPQFRLSHDEINRARVAKAFLDHKHVDTVEEATFFDGHHTNRRTAHPFRGLLHSFMIYVVHVVTGYRTENGFIVNFITFTALLSMLFALFRKYLGSGWAWAGVFAVLAHPIISITTTSNQYEPILALFILLSCVYLKRFLDEPHEMNFRALWVVLLLLAHTRNESFLYLIITAGYLVITGYVPLRFFRCSPIYAWTPVFFLPILNQVRIFMGFIDGAVGKPMFSLVNFVKGNSVFLEEVFAFKPIIPISHVLCITGILSIMGLTYAFLTAYRHSFQNRTKHLIIITALNLTALWIMIMAQAGPINQSSATRMLYIHCIVFSICTVMMLHRIPLFRRNGWRVCGLMIFVFLFHQSVAVEHVLATHYWRYRKYSIVNDFLKKQAGGNYLLITNQPELFTMHPVGSISFHRANTRKAQILKEYAERYYNDMFVIQEIDKQTHNALRSHLDPNYQLEHLEDVELGHSNYYRISRVSNAKP